MEDIIPINLNKQELENFRIEWIKKYDPEFINSKSPNAEPQKINLKNYNKNVEDAAKLKPFANYNPIPTPGSIKREEAKKKFEEIKKTYENFVNKNIAWDDWKTIMNRALMGIRGLMAFNFMFPGVMADTEIREDYEKMMAEQEKLLDIAYQEAMKNYDKLNPLERSALERDLNALPFYNYPAEIKSKEFANVVNNSLESNIIPEKNTEKNKMDVDTNDGVEYNNETLYAQNKPDDSWKRTQNLLFSNNTNVKNTLVLSQIKQFQQLLTNITNNISVIKDAENATVENPTVELTNQIAENNISQNVTELNNDAFAPVVADPNDVISTTEISEPTSSNLQDPNLIEQEVGNTVQVFDKSTGVMSENQVPNAIQSLQNAEKLSVNGQGYNATQQMPNMTQLASDIINNVNKLVYQQQKPAQLNDTTNKPLENNNVQQEQILIDPLIKETTLQPLTSERTPKNKDVEQTISEISEMTKELSNVLPTKFLEDIILNEETTNFDFFFANFKYLFNNLDLVKQDSTNLPANNYFQNINNLQAQQENFNILNVLSSKDKFQSSISINNLLKPDRIKFYIDKLNILQAVDNDYDQTHDLLLSMYLTKQKNQILDKNLRNYLSLNEDKIFSSISNLLSIYVRDKNFDLLNTLFNTESYQYNTLNKKTVDLIVQNFVIEPLASTGIEQTDVSIQQLYETGNLYNQLKTSWTLSLLDNPLFIQKLKNDPNLINIVESDTSDKLKDVIFLKNVLNTLTNWQYEIDKNELNDYVTKIFLDNNSSEKINVTMAVDVYQKKSKNDITNKINTIGQTVSNALNGLKKVRRDVFGDPINSAEYLPALLEGKEGNNSLMDNVYYMGQKFKDIGVYTINTTDVIINNVLDLFTDGQLDMAKYLLTDVVIPGLYLYRRFRNPANNQIIDIPMMGFEMFLNSVANYANNIRPATNNFQEAYYQTNSIYDNYINQLDTESKTVRRLFHSQNDDYSRLYNVDMRFPAAIYNINKNKDVPVRISYSRFMTRLLESRQATLTNMRNYDDRIMRNFNFRNQIQGINQLTGEAIQDYQQVIFNSARNMLKNLLTTIGDISALYRIGRVPIPYVFNKFSELISYGEPILKQKLIDYKVADKQNELIDKSYELYDRAIDMFTNLINNLSEYVEFDEIEDELVYSFKDKNYWKEGDWLKPNSTNVRKYNILMNYSNQIDYDQKSSPKKINEQTNMNSIDNRLAFKNFLQENTDTEISKKELGVKVFKNDINLPLKQNKKLLTIINDLTFNDFLQHSKNTEEIEKLQEIETFDDNNLFKYNETFIDDNLQDLDISLVNQVNKTISQNATVFNKVINDRNFDDSEKLANVYDDLKDLGIPVEQNLEIDNEFVGTTTSNKTLALVKTLQNANLNKYGELCYDFGNYSIESIQYILSRNKLTKPSIYEDIPNDDYTNDPIVKDTTTITPPITKEPEFYEGDDVIVESEDKTRDELSPLAQQLLEEKKKNKKFSLWDYIPQSSSDLASAATIAGLTFLVGRRGVRAAQGDIQGAIGQGIKSPYKIKSNKKETYNDKINKLKNLENLRKINLKNPNLVDKYVVGKGIHNQMKELINGEPKFKDYPMYKDNIDDKVYYNEAVNGMFHIKPKKEIKKEYKDFGGCEKCDKKKINSKYYTNEKNIMCNSCLEGGKVLNGKSKYNDNWMPLEESKVKKDEYEKLKHNTNMANKLDEKEENTHVKFIKSSKGHFKNPKKVLEDSYRDYQHYGDSTNTELLALMLGHHHHTPKETHNSIFKSNLNSLIINELSSRTRDYDGQYISYFNFDNYPLLLTKLKENPYFLKKYLV
jgi:hypothetical protein